MSMTLIQPHRTECGHRSPQRRTDREESWHGQVAEQEGERREDCGGYLQSADCQSRLVLSFMAIGV